MLAQNFKSAAELKITEQQHDALQKVLVLLETGKLHHKPAPRQYRGGQGHFTGHFNMAYWKDVHSCGTVACIGGTAELISGCDFIDTDPRLTDLFYPRIDRIDHPFERILPEEAALALRNYLTNGEADWESILC